MVNWLLGLSDEGKITGRDYSFAAEQWVVIVAAFLALGAIGLAYYAYHGELRVSKNRRIVMGVCKAMALLTIIFMLLKPVAAVYDTKFVRHTILVLLDSSASMNYVDGNKSDEDIVEAAAVLGEIPLGKKAADVATLRSKVEKVSRFDLARAALTNEEMNVVGELEKTHDVRFYSFADRITPDGTGEEGTDWLTDRQADGEASNVGSAIADAVGRQGGRDIDGVVVLSDFAWADGQDPIVVAQDLKIADTPVFPISIGSPKSPDIRIMKIIAPKAVFPGDEVPLRIQLKSHQFDKSSIDLTLYVDGEAKGHQLVELAGGMQFASIPFVPEREAGVVELEVKCEPLEGEMSDTNNSAKHSVKIIDEKIKVLYIEGMPRWEYRYLRWVLLRDPRIDVTFLMTQGDPNLAAASPQHLGRFPQVAKDAFQYDLVILGDVPASYFNSTQMELMEGLVKERGGSLLMIAGPMAAPATYADSPIADILPVKLGSGRWRSIGGSPLITAAGRESNVTSLVDSPEVNDRIWSNVRPLYLPDLGGAKASATVLLSTEQEGERTDEYPLLAWHRSGKGKGMFVATEDLWRMRLEVGDKHHARFWGQAIQFLSLSRLLGDNKQITLETDRAACGPGELVHIYANVLTDLFEPVEEDSFSVYLRKNNSKGGDDSPPPGSSNDSEDNSQNGEELRLKPVPGTPGLYSGVFLASDVGAYQVTTSSELSGNSNQTEFVVRKKSLEKRETEAKPEVALQVGDLSGGKSLSLADLATLSTHIRKTDPKPIDIETTEELWDAPLLFILLVMFVGTEWYLRRRDNLV